ncbi:MAG TPA: UbiA prenyltransferase family protein [Candidatus Dojkabacteria bacterium]|nr:UbiA prenyltransferase family protein [Candidatus Dojkabacteria bacterium]
MEDIRRLLRVNQWVKNVFIFLPAFFGFRLFDVSTIVSNGYAFLSFCFLASSIYVLNDIVDRGLDRRHPKKKDRPIVSGKVSVKKAVVIFFVLLFLSFLFSFPIRSTELYLLLCSYLVLNVLYTFFTKNVAIIDVFSVALGYVIRVLVGGVSGDVEVSCWIVVMTFLLCLFLCFAKRRDDVVLMEGSGKEIRKSVNGYTVEFMNSILEIISAVIIALYIMYTVSEQTMERYNSDYVYMTSLFVLLGIFRYLQITISFKKSGSPTDVLYKDRFLQLCILGWILCFAVIIYV